ncbi:MAG TPA: protein kinase [Candidatus Polarisedimenticolia bacterium]|nr:protein kinase [Candidatus Polarisedimenticolia bacterium]
MRWSPGTKLGPYEILAPLGVGGMGEVYRARDTRLNRDVAIKAIPAALAGQEQFRQRFEREAKAISSLNHPHICTLYDVGHAAVESESRDDGPGRLHYLVMELLEGESLADRLQKGPLPLHEVLKYGRQIASALDAAHRREIIHRDLKPGNIMLTKSGAKLLDFGLARTAAGDTPPLGGRATSGSHMATALSPDAHPLTTQGTILGTFQYMAPEQLEGTDADARTDIFALGALLYEMATGTRAFQGSSRTSLIAAIVSAQPAPISSVTAMTPPALDHVVQRCLEKDPDDRWQSAHDVAAELQWLGEAGSQVGAAAPIARGRKTREKIAWGLAAVLGLALLALGIGSLSETAPPAPRAFRATLSPPPDSALIPFDLMGLALSPDGTTLAFVAIGSDGKRQIWLRNLSEMNARPVAETVGAMYPFWSPDGRNLAFFADAKLKTIDLRGGSPRILADAPTGRGGSWSRDGVILFAPNITSPIHKISAEGGAPAPVTKHDPETEVTHRWPVFLPDGRHFLYVSRTRATGRREMGRLMLASLDAADASVLIEDATNAQYVEPGYLIYGRSANLYAWRFDAAALRLEGQAVPLLKEKMSFWEAKNFIPFAASDDRTLVYLPEANRSTQMRWYDRQGRPLGALGPPGFNFSPRISPDGRKVAYVSGESAQSPSDLWIRDLEFDRTYRLTQQSGLYSTPAWAPDSDRIVLLCQPKGVQDLCLTSLSGGGAISPLYESSTWKETGSWMPDGKRLLFSSQDPETDQDIMMLPAGGGEPIPILRTPFAENEAQISPDGSRIAYVSNQSGRFEVYVRSLEAAAGQWQISSNGGGQARWSADGKELVYASADGYLMTVPIQTGSTFRPGTPVRLFAAPELSDSRDSGLEDITPDGQRILVNVPTTSRTSIGFHIITNWTSLLVAGGT